MFMNSERYSDVLQQQLKPAIQTKRKGLLSSGMSGA
jgi:shikimate kinase